MDQFVLMHVNAMDNTELLFPAVHDIPLITCIVMNMLKGIPQTFVSYRLVVNISVNDVYKQNLMLIPPPCKSCIKAIMKKVYYIALYYSL